MHFFICMHQLTEDKLAMFSISYWGNPVRPDLFNKTNEGLLLSKLLIKSEIMPHYSHFINLWNYRVAAAVIYFNFDLVLIPINSLIIKALRLEDIGVVKVFRDTVHVTLTNLNGK